MIISVASGKGGTGKTTVATNIALSIGNVQFLDCDVEEPNANIFLQAKIKEQQDVVVRIPEIDKQKCDYCGRCSEFCAYNALAVVRSNVLVFPELCHSCGGCELVCPKDAITWKERVIGKIEHGQAKGIDFYQGILRVGEAQAIPVIKALKRKIDKNKDVILDVPPGTSCPVIESITGSDYCILVTEPTPFGLHDLKLAVEVVRHLSIPFGVIINRDGIGDERVEVYCQKENIPVLLKIPERKKIALLYSKGIALVKEAYEWHEMFGLVFNRIREEVKK
ncbi:MAG TPA: (4Fe-4S)-binding protein [Thermoplasmatales archaeon]|mgnify:CR=1 FL=1|nr:(4Fe-4S)-binding protein [Thermoplasmatales archaeon]